jgi:hypothetical protein
MDVDITKTGLTGFTGYEVTSISSKFCKSCPELVNLNNIENIFQVAPALTGITSNFTSPKPPIQSKSTCHPPTTRPGGVRSERAPG